MIKNRKQDLSQITVSKIKSFLFKEVKKDLVNKLNCNKEDQKQEELFVQSMFQENETDYIEDIEARKQQSEQQICKEVEEIKKMIKEGQKKLYEKSESESLTENLILDTVKTEELFILGDFCTPEEESE